MQVKHLTIVTEVINKNDLSNKLRWASIQDTVRITNNSLTALQPRLKYNETISVNLIVIETVEYMHYG